MERYTNAIVQPNEFYHNTYNSDRCDVCNSNSNNKNNFNFEKHFCLYLGTDR